MLILLTRIYLYIFV